MDAALGVDEFVQQELRETFYWIRLMGVIQDNEAIAQVLMSSDVVQPRRPSGDLDQPVGQEDQGGSEETNILISADHSISCRQPNEEPSDNESHNSSSISDSIKAFASDEVMDSIEDNSMCGKVNGKIQGSLTDETGEDMQNCDKDIITTADKDSGFTSDAIMGIDDITALVTISAQGGDMDRVVSSASAEEHIQNVQSTAPKAPFTNYPFDVSETDENLHILKSIKGNYELLQWKYHCSLNEHWLGYHEEDESCPIISTLSDTSKVTETNRDNSKYTRLDSDGYFLNSLETFYSNLRWTSLNAPGEMLYGTIQSSFGIEEDALAGTVDKNESIACGNVKESCILHGIPSLDKDEELLADDVSVNLDITTEATDLNIDPVVLPEIYNLTHPEELNEKPRTDSWVSTCSSDLSFPADKFRESTEKVQTGTQTCTLSVSNQETQVAVDVDNVQVQTEGEIAQCCQCNVYTFLPLGEQFVLRLKEEMSQRISLENLIKIVERDAWNIRQELMDERETVVGLQGEAADLKGKLSHAEHISSELKTRNDELESSLDGARNMINKLEQQISNTTYFNSGIDYMLEAKLSKGRAVEAIAKVEMLQNELLHSQGEVQKLLNQLAKLSQEKNKMVSSSVHRELLQVAEDKVKDAELRSLQLENEVLALKEENKQLQSLRLSSESDLPLAPSSRPYKFMFTEEIDPYKEIMSMKYDMLNLKSSSLADRPISPPPVSYSTRNVQSTTQLTDIQSVSNSSLPDLNDFSASYPHIDPPEFISVDDQFNGGPLIATGSDSDDSDWSDDDNSDVIHRPDLPTTHQEVVLDRLHGADRIKPTIPAKPVIPPKPKAGLIQPELITSRQRSQSLHLEPRSEKSLSFEEAPSTPHLTIPRKPVGPKGRQPPSRFSRW